MSVLELVLSVILPAFSFEEAEEIVWRLGITVVPLIKGKEDKGLSVPMKVKSLLVLLYLALLKYSIDV